MILFKVKDTSCTFLPATHPSKVPGQSMASLTPTMQHSSSSSGTIHVKEEEESQSEGEEEREGETRSSPWSRPPSPQAFPFHGRRHQDSPSSHPDSTTSPAPLIVRMPSPPLSLPSSSSSSSSSSVTQVYPSFQVGTSRHLPPHLSDLVPSYPGSLYPHLLHPSLYPHLVPSYLLHPPLPPLLPALDPPPPLHIARPIPKLPGKHVPLDPAKIPLSVKIERDPGSLAMRNIHQPSF